jgi:hypothetical protein
LPFLPHLVNMTASLDLYARNWEFAGFAFNSIRAVTGSGTIAHMLLSGCFLLAVLFATCRLAIRINATLSPAARGRQALEACYAIAMALLLLTPTLQPWYALCLAVFLPFCAGPAGLVLCWAVFLTYLVQIPYFILGQWTEKRVLRRRGVKEEDFEPFMIRIMQQAEALYADNYWLMMATGSMQG